MELFAYTGDVKKLKSLGYKFQKLYARNHKTYHKDNIFMFVICKMVLEIDNLKLKNQVAFIDFVLANADKPKSFWISDKQCGNLILNDMANFAVTHFGNIVTENVATDLMFEAKREVYHLIDNNASDEEINAAIEKSHEYEGGFDPWYIKWELVQQILELNALHPLEKVLDHGFK